MSNIRILQNVVVDENKVRELLQQSTVEDIQQLFGVKKSAAYNFRRGSRMPNVNNLLRMMMLHSIRPEDLATVEAGK